ncbi:hemolysin family protein [Nakamurella sp. A5-74]|uniref:Hemolysin family protein n=1 Tax=Nakamurella sp. A5-74 TaxID=3158264 RepID=A0AAU8DV67_9ACTN
MDALDIVLLVIAGLLVPFAGLMAAADAAIIMVSPARVEEAMREGRRGAASLRRIVADKPRYTNLLLLLRVGSECAATVLVAAVALSTWGFRFWVLLMVVGVMIVVTYVVIGVLPRTIGRQHPSGVGFFMAGTVAGLGRFLSPIASLLILIGNAITPGRGFREGPFSSEIELRELVDMAQVHGVVEESEREMLHSVFQLGDTIAREVMVPRTEVVWIERQKSMRQALQLASRSGLSRIPVVGDDVDDITGVIYIKDLVARTLVVEPGSAGPEVGELVRAPFFVPDSKPIPDLLAEMQRTRTHFAVVVDEYGGTAGIVTIEDILEEIVGEITDEYDVESPELIEVLGDGRFRVSTRVLVEDLGELFDVSLPAEDVETVGGLFAQLLGRVPLPMSEAEINGLHLLGEPGVDRRGRPRVMTLIISRIQDPAMRSDRDDGHPSATAVPLDDSADDGGSSRDDGGSTGAEKSAKADKPERPKGKNKPKNKTKNGKAPKAELIAESDTDSDGANSTAVEPQHTEPPQAEQHPTRRAER